MTVSEQKKKYNREYQQKLISDRDESLERLRESFKGWGIVVNDKEKLVHIYIAMIDKYRLGYVQGYNARVLQVEGVDISDVPCADYGTIV